MKSYTIKGPFVRFSGNEQDGTTINIFYHDKFFTLVTKDKGEWKDIPESFLQEIRDMQKDEDERKDNFVKEITPIVESIIRKVIV